MSSTRIVSIVFLAWLASRWYGPTKQHTQQIEPAHSVEQPLHCPHHLYTYSLFTEGAHLGPSSLELGAAAASAAPANAPAPLLLEMSFRLQDASRYMPVLGADTGRGIEHQLLKTSTLLQYLALLNEKLEALQCNSRADGVMKPLSEWRFAVPHTAIQWAAAHARATASNASSSDELAASVASILGRAQCGDSRLFRDAPPSTLLTIPGSSVAAVADIIRARLLPVPSSGPNSAAAAQAAAAADETRVVLTLSVVAKPRIINEFEPHPMHTLGDEEHEHYHFFTISGTEVNAAKLLTQLLGSADPRDWSERTSATLPELHLFIKGIGPCRNVSDTVAPGADVSQCWDPLNTDLNTWSGDTCTTTCQAGFQPSPTEPVILCWAANSSSITPYNWTLVSGACALIPPPPPPGCRSDPSTTPQHATWPAGGCLGVNGSVPDGTQCFATCITGYSGNPYYTCNASSWIPGPPGCLPNPCLGNPTATAPAGSSWPASGCGQFGQPAQSGSSCTAPCNSGFSPLPTAPTSLCSLGSWSTVSGACSPNPCIGLPTASVPGGGTWPAACINTASNASCTAVCSTGLTGAPSISCYAGQWQEPVRGPACVNCSTQLVAVSGSSLCAGAAALTALFRFTAAAVAQVSFVATIDGIPNSCTPPGSLTGPQPAGTLVTVTCPAPAGGFSVGSHTIALTATSTGSAGTLCPTTTKTAAATAVITPAPSITMSLAAEPAPGCRSPGTPKPQTLKAIFQYAVVPNPDNGPLSLTAAATAAAGATCTVSSPTAATGTVEVACSGTFSSSTTAMDITLTLSASQSGCGIVTATASTSVPFVCCTASGTRATTIFDGTTSNKCKDCGSSVLYYTQGTGSATLFTNLTTTSACLSQAPAGALAVGSLGIRCSDAGNAILFAVSAPAFSKISASFVVRCSESVIRACPAPSVTRVASLSNNPAFNVVSTSNAGGASLTWQKVLIPPVDSCLCRDAFIAVTVTGTFYDVAC